MSTKTTKASNKIRASAPGRTAMKPIATLTNGPALLGYARVVERTFAWMTRWRRLVRDYEERIDCSEAMIHVALGSVLLRRIAHE